MANPQTNEKNIQILKECIDELAKAIGDQFQRINTVSSGNPEYNIDHLETVVKTNLVAAINSLVTIKNPQRLVQSGRLFAENDNCYDLIFRSASDIVMEVPNFTTERFECGMYNEGPGNVSFVAQSGANLDLPDGTVLEAKKVATLFKILNENNQVIKGELITPTP